MCDTFTVFLKDKNRSFFGKNSDRDPGEPQILQIVSDPKKDFQSDFLEEKLSKYTDGPLLRLRNVFSMFDHPYGALISRPVWMWGAEMGVNEKGLAIGNEAVFSKEKQQKEGLLGMDILRLALHNAATAEEANEFIIHLIEKYGQGGNGSYSGSLKYHNSFLIKDTKEAIVLETSGKHWAHKRIHSFGSISNAYSLGLDYDKVDSDSKGHNFKKRYENPFFTFFSKGNFRQKYTCNAVGANVKDTTDAISLLRSHIRGDDRLSRGMKSICVHPGTIVKSESTASMVVDYVGDRQIIWHTSSPNPCVSLFKPIIWPKNADDSPLFSNMHSSLDYFLENRKFSEYFVKNQAFFQREIRQKRNVLQQAFLNRIYGDLQVKDDSTLIDDIQACYQMEKEYLVAIGKLIER